MPEEFRWRRHVGHPENHVDDPAEGFTGGPLGYWAFIIGAMILAALLAPFVFAAKVFRRLKD